MGVKTVTSRRSAPAAPHYFHTIHTTWENIVDSREGYLIRIFRQARDQPVQERAFTARLQQYPAGAGQIDHQTLTTEQGRPVSTV
jgi:hypothetical protein